MENDFFQASKRFVRMCRNAIAEHLNSTHNMNITKDDVSLVCLHTEGDVTSLTAAIPNMEDAKIEIVFYGRTGDYVINAYRKYDSVTSKAKADDVEYLRIITEQE